MYVSFLQLEEGYEPTSVIPNALGAPRAELPFQGLVLGRRTIGYGASPPSKGKYEVGDIVLNTSPSVGGSIGWVCTHAGEPGVFRPFGRIE